jgi:HPt (histidine-containing phosphotransfer) domain-containing protein
MGAVVDLTQLRDSLVNEARVQAVVELFMADAPRLLASIDESLNAGHWSDLAKAVHTLKGASQYFGSVDLVDACQNLEQAAALGATTPEGAVADLVAKVGNACALVQLALQEQQSRSTG